MLLWTLPDLVILLAVTTDMLEHTNLTWVCVFIMAPIFTERVVGSTNFSARVLISLGFGLIL